MGNEVVVVPNEQHTSHLPVSKRDVDDMIAQRDRLKEFVKSQLVEAKFEDSKSASYGEGDYGIIPGTKKRCLFKQGAEKFQKLFSLGVKFELISQIIDREKNFAMFTYKAKIYSLRNPDVTIAECEASTNSQETKYKTRRVWKKKKVGNREISEQIEEETPIYDVLNTLQKMAQKRAMIGATILATGASEYFTQDVLEPEDIAPPKAPAAAGATVPPAASAPAGSAPVCCGKPMMLSKYPNRVTQAIDWYCLGCKTSRPQDAGAA